MEVTYLGHSSFKIKTKNAVIVTDPFDESMVGIKFPKISADIVTVSHEHDDHNNIANIKNIRKVIAGPGEYEILGVSIIGLPSFHDAKKGEEKGKNTIYVFEAEGLRIAHLGDIGHKPDQSQIEDLGQIDILMIPVGGVYTINSEIACEVVRMIEPSFVLPMHYKTNSHKAEAFGELAGVEDFTKELALPVENMEKLVVKGSIAEGEQKTIVLVPQNG